MDADLAGCQPDATHPLDDTFFPPDVERALAVRVHARHAATAVVGRGLRAGSAAIAPRVVLDRALAPALVSCMRKCPLCKTNRVS